MSIPEKNRRDRVQLMLPEINVLDEYSRYTRLSCLRLHAYIIGDVQGVGFRWNTQQQADRLQITGWVRNLADGRVEVVADSENEEILTRFLAWLRHGPRGAVVSDLEYDFSDADEDFDHFSIVS